MSGANDALRADEIGESVPVKISGWHPRSQSAPTALTDPLQRRDSASSEMEEISKAIVIQIDGLRIGNFGEQMRELSCGSGKKIGDGLSSGRIENGTINGSAAPFHQDKGAENRGWPYVLMGLLPRPSVWPFAPERRLVAGDGLSLHGAQASAMNNSADRSWLRSGPAKVRTLPCSGPEICTCHLSEPVAAWITSRSNELPALGEGTLVRTTWS